MRTQWLAIFLVLLGFTSLEAATVSVLVVESGLPAGNGCSPSAEVWESGMMDVFFDAGHIVSNAPCHQIDQFSAVMPPEINGDFDDARIGGADFFVLVLLNYKGDCAEDAPKEVNIRVFRVSTGSLLYETEIAERLWENVDQEFLDAKQYAGKVVPQLAKKG